MTADNVSLDRETVQWVIQYLSEDLGCDHAVNICTCETAEVVHRLQLALDNKRVCPMCGGDGISPLSDEIDPCPACGSSGALRLDQNVVVWRDMDAKLPRSGLVVRKAIDVTQLVVSPHDTPPGHHVFVDKAFLL